MKAKVLAFVPADSGYPGWWVLTLDNGKIFLVHHNWTKNNGALKPGEEVEYEPAPVPVYNSVYAFVKDLRRVGKAAIVE